MLKITPILLALQSFFFLSVHISPAAIITSITVKEKEGIATNNYPLTFAIPFKKGEVTAGIIVKHNGTPISTQFDIKRRWADSSVKHGIISVLIPTVAANGIENLSIETASSNISTGELDKAAILATDVDSVIAMSNMTGSGNPGTASGSLRSAINDGNLSYWLKGPICTEIIDDILITPNDNLHARWEARFYPGSSFGIRISNIAESTNLIATGGSVYDVIITQGKKSPSLVYSKTGYSHGYGSRWRRTFWLGAKPPEVEIQYNTAYLANTKMVAALDPNIMPTSAMLDSMKNKTVNWDSYNQRGGIDIDGTGNLIKYFPAPGGRDDIGLYPAWVAYWLQTGDNRAKYSSLVTADAAGHVTGVHFREGDGSRPFYGRPAISIDSRTNITLQGWAYTCPTMIGNKTTNNWAPDRAHQSGAVYIPYLLTGEHYYLEELHFWASFNIAFNVYKRNGGGALQDFSSYFSDQGDAAGIFYGQTRETAWGLRNVNDAAALAPDSDANLILYYKNKIRNNIRWFNLANSATTGHSLGLFRGTREGALTDPAGYTYFEPPWMHDFLVIVLNDIIRKQEGLEEPEVANTIRDRLGAFTIGKCINSPQLSPYDGTVFYNIPTQKKDGTYSWTWAELQQAYKDVSDVNTQIGNQGSIATSFASIHTGDGESRLYITKAALAGLEHLPGWQEAWNFIKTHTVTSAMQQKPQWGGLVEKIYLSSPQIKTINAK